MKPRILPWVFFMLLFGIGPVQGQGFRGGMGGGRSAAAGVQATPSAGFAGTSHTAMHSASPGSSQQGRSPTNPVTVTQYVIPPSAPGQNGWASQWRFWTTAPFFVRPPVFFHGHGHFPNRSPILFIEVPQFIGPSITTTQFIPNGGWTGTPLTENYPTDSGVRAPGQLAPFDPTPQEIVERMLVLAAIRKGDVLYDLGAGDGRVVVTAAKKYGVRAVGFEIDPGLVKLARENARKQGVEKLVEIRQQDFMNADLSPATVVTLYLSYDGNLALRPKLMRELKPSARVVSYTFDMGDWQPKIAESYRDAGGDTHMLYLWHMAEPLAFSNDSRWITLNAQ